MIIFKENKQTGFRCGINNYGELFLGDNRSCYTLEDTEENRERIKKDFNFYNE